MTTMTDWMPARVDPSRDRVELGHPVVDGYLELVRVRCRPNTVLAAAYDLRVFFGVVARVRWRCRRRTCWSSSKAQRSSGSGNVVRLADGGSGVALSTIRRRLSSISGLYGYLV